MNNVSCKIITTDGHSHNYTELLIWLTHTLIIWSLLQLIMKKFKNGE